MICLECAKEKKLSKVYSGVPYTTLSYSLPFYDELGRPHDHNNNISVVNYSCSNGHIWEERSVSKCWCGQEELKK